MHNSKRQLIQIALTANILEWYEFCISAYLAATMGQVFFASSTPVIAIIQSFSVFALSYLARPLGSMLFGYWGDKYSSSMALRAATLMMTMPTVFIAILPTYATIGYSAPILLIGLRIVQGIAAGGELPLSAAYVYAQVQQQKYGMLWCSLTNLGSVFGILLASVVVFVLYLVFSQAYITAFAWRLPFLLSIPVSMLILYLRRTIAATNMVLESKTSTKTSIIMFMKAILLIAFIQVNCYILFIWFPSYLQYFLGVSYITARITNVIALAILAIFTLFFAYLDKFIRYKYLLLGEIILSLGLVYPLFLILPKANFAILLLIQLIFAIFLASLNSGYFFTLGQMFGGKSRNKAMAIVFTVPTAVFGGTAPLVCSYVIHKTGFMAFPSIYIMLFGLLALPAIITL